MVNAPRGNVKFHGTARGTAILAVRAGGFASFKAHAALPPYSQLNALA